MQLISAIDWADCTSYAASHSKTEVCDTCKCNFVQDSLEYDTAEQCIGNRNYISRVTLACEHCSDARVIHNHECLVSLSEDLKPCLPGHVKNYDVGANGLCVKCVRGFFSENTDSVQCQQCPNGFTTEHEGIISPNDCVFCPQHDYMIFDEISKTYQCNLRDLCHTNRQQAHMLDTCSKCEVVDIMQALQVFGEDRPPNCALSGMSSCNSYFTTSDVLKTCIDVCGVDRSDAVCDFCPSYLASPDFDTEYVGIFLHLKFFIPNLFTPLRYSRSNGLDQSEQLMVVYYTLTKDRLVENVGTQYKWLEYSNVINKQFADDKIANYRLCTNEIFTAGTELASCLDNLDYRDDCLNEWVDDKCTYENNLEYNTDDEFMSTYTQGFISTAPDLYVQSFPQHREYYSAIPDFIIPPILSSQKIITSSHCMYDDVISVDVLYINITTRNIGLNAITSMTINDSSQKFTTVQTSSATGQTSLDFNVELEDLKDICTITFTAHTNRKTHVKFYVEFIISIQDNTRVSVGVTPVHTYQNHCHARQNQDYAHTQLQALELPCTYKIMVSYLDYTHWQLGAAKYSPAIAG